MGNEKMGQYRMQRILTFFLAAFCALIGVARADDIEWTMLNAEKHPYYCEAATAAAQRLNTPAMADPKSFWWALRQSGDKDISIKVHRNPEDYSVEIVALRIGKKVMLYFAEGLCDVYRPEFEKRGLAALSDILKQDHRMADDLRHHPEMQKALGQLYQQILAEDQINNP